MVALIISSSDESRSMPCYPFPVFNEKERTGSVVFEGGTEANLIMPVTLVEKEICWRKAIGLIVFRVLVYEDSCEVTFGLVAAVTKKVIFSNI